MRRYLYLAGAVLCILFLYFLSVISHPYEIDISDVDNYEGKVVTVEGIVAGKECGDTFEMLTIRDGNHSAQVFVYGSTGVQYGDRLRVTGKVERYGGRMEIHAKTIEVVEKWDGESMPLWELSENFMDYVGTNVNVTGYIYGLHGGYFYLTDFDREYRIKVYHPENFSVRAGDHEHVSVRATFRYDSESMCMYLEINGKNHGVSRID